MIMQKKHTHSQSAITTNTVSHTPQQDNEEEVGASTVTSIQSYNSLCPICQKTPNPQCLACNHRNTSVQKHNFDLFVQAIIDYKQGRSRAVVEEMLEKKTKSSLNQKVQRNSVYLSGDIQETPKKSVLQRKSCGQMSISRESSSKTSNEVIHEGIECDGCLQLPIIGVRYKCKNCADFDLCSKCMNQGKHMHHDFHVIRVSKRQQQVQKLRQSVQHQYEGNQSYFGSLMRNFQSIFI